MTSHIKNKIIIALSISTLVLIWLVFSKDEVIESVTTTKIEYIPRVSELPNTKPAEVRLIKIKVPTTVNTVEKVTDTIWKDKEVKEYSYVDSLPNGVITSTIIADNIYNRSVKLKTLDKVVTSKTVNTIVKDALFLEFGANQYVDRSVRDVNLSIDFTRKNKWRIGVTGGYDFMIKDAFVGLKFGIPLN